MATMKGKRVLTSLYLDPEVAGELKRLSTETRVPQAVYLREAVDLLLAHYRRFSNMLLHPGEEPPPIPEPPMLERFIRAANLKEATDAKKPTARTTRSARHK